MLESIPRAFSAFPYLHKIVMFFEVYFWAVWILVSFVLLLFAAAARFSQIFSHPQLFSCF
jgi:uncharacterized membrane protein